jgi:hypothetical protein
MTACVSEELDKVARNLSSCERGAADVRLIRHEATDEARRCLIEARWEGFGSTQKVDRGVGDLGSGEAGVLGKQMAGLLDLWLADQPDSAQWGIASIYDFGLTTWLE